MEIQILGTSSGAPSKLRNVSASTIQHRHSKHWCLVDCGEGTQHQLLHTKHSLATLDAILITHVHGDHCYGLPGLVSSAAMSGRTEPLTIVGPQAVLDWLVVTREMSQSRSHFDLQFLAVEDLPERIELGGFIIEHYPLSHRVPCWAYGFYETNIQRKLDQEKLKMDGIPAGADWGKIQQGQDIELNDQIFKADDYLLPPREPRKVIIAGDNDKPEILSAAVQDANVLFHEATYTQEVSEKVGSWPQHSSAKMVAEFAKNSGLENLVLMHFSPRYHKASMDQSIDVIAAEAGAYYNGTLFLAQDFARYCLHQDGTLEKV